MGRLLGLSLTGCGYILTAIIVAGIGRSDVAWGQTAAGHCPELSALRNTEQDASGALSKCITESSGSVQLEPGIYTIAKEVIVSKEISISTLGITRDSGPCGSGGRTCAALFRSPEFVGANPPATRGTNATLGGGGLLRLTGAKASLHHLEVNGVKSLLTSPRVNDSLIVISECRDCSVDALAFKDGSGRAALSIERSKNVSVKDSLFEGNGSSTALTSGIEVRSSSNVDILGNFFKNSSKFDINVVSCSDCEVARNVMWHTTSSRITAAGALRVGNASVSAHDNVADCDSFGCTTAFVFGSTTNTVKQGEKESSIGVFNNVASHSLNGFQFGLRSKIELVNNYTLGNTGLLKCPTTKAYRFAKLPGATITQNGASPKLADIVEAKPPTKPLSQREREGCLAMLADTRSGASRLSGRKAFLLNAASLAFKNVLGRAPSADELSASSMQLAQGTSLTDLITGIEALKDVTKNRVVPQVSLPNGASAAPGSQREGRPLLSDGVSAVTMAASAKAGATTAPAPPTNISLALGSTYGSFSLNIGPSPAANTTRQYSVVYRSSRPAGCTATQCPPAAIGALFPNTASWAAFGAGSRPITLTSNPPELCAFIRARYARGTTYSAPVYRTICNTALPTPEIRLETHSRFIGSIKLYLSKMGLADSTTEYNVASLPELPTGCTTTSCPHEVANALFSSQVWVDLGVTSTLIPQTLIPRPPQRCAVVRARLKVGNKPSSPAYAARCYDEIDDVARASVEIFSGRTTNAAYLDPESRFLDGAQLVFTFGDTSVGTAKIKYNIEPVDRFMSENEMRSRRWGDVQILQPTFGKESAYLPITFSDSGQEYKGCVAIRYKPDFNSNDWKYLSQCANCAPPVRREVFLDRIVLERDAATTTPDVQIFQPALPFQPAPFAPRRGEWRTVTGRPTLTPTGQKLFDIRFDQLQEFDRNKPTLIRYRHDQSGCGYSPYEYRFQISKPEELDRAVTVPSSSMTLSRDGRPSTITAQYSLGQIPKVGQATRLDLTSRWGFIRAGLGDIATPGFGGGQGQQIEGSSGTFTVSNYLFGSCLAEKLWASRPGVSAPPVYSSECYPITATVSKVAGKPTRYNFFIFFQPETVRAASLLRLEYAVANLGVGGYINETRFTSEPAFTFPVDQSGRAELGASTGVQRSNQPHPCIHVRARAVYKDLETNLEFKSPYTLFERCAD
jgi:hypothetical protein